MKPEDIDRHYKKMHQLISELGITVTNDTKPTELFEAVTKLLAAYVAAQPSNDEIADYTARKMKRDRDSAMRGHGLR